MSLGWISNLGKVARLIAAIMVEADFSEECEDDEVDEESKAFKTQSFDRFSWSIQHFKHKDFRLRLQPSHPRRNL